MIIREAKPTEIEELAVLRYALWREGTEEEHLRELEDHFAGSWMLPAQIFVAVAEDGSLKGFSEVSIRPHAEACTTDRVGYLEGWYVDPDAQRKGIGRRLVEAAESWAREKGCTEFASDTEEANHVSAAAHAALGFEDVGLVRCFKKMLEP